MDTYLAKKALMRALIDKCECSAQTASKLAAGAMKPSLARATEIEQKIGIPATAWHAGSPIGEMWKIVMRNEK